MVDDHNRRWKGRRRRFPLLLVALPVAATAAAAVIAAHPALAAPVTVQITSVPNGIFPQISCWAFSPDNCIFDPANVTLSAGSAVTWVNDSGAAQTIAADDGSFSVPVAIGSSGSHVFGTPGTYHYHGEGPYPNLRGTVTVTGPPPLPLPPPPPHPALPAPAVAPAPVAPTPVAPATATPAPTPSPSEDAAVPGPLLLTPGATPSPSHRTIATVASHSSGRSPWFYIAAILIFAAVLAAGAAIWRLRQQRPRSLPPAPHPSQVFGIPRPPATPATDHGGWLEL